MTMKSKVKDVARTLTAALAPEKPVEETDILETLKNEHNDLKDLLQQLQEASGAAPRRQLVGQIQEALVPHTQAEEKVVYDAIIALGNEAASIDAHEGYLEHEIAAKTLQRLARMHDADGPEHHAAAKVLKELVEHHIDEEESLVWKDVREKFSAETRLQMNLRFLTARSRVRVH